MFRASLVAQMVKNLPAMQETCVQSLGWEDPLEEGMATHSSVLSGLSSLSASVSPDTRRPVRSSGPSLSQVLWLWLTSLRRHTLQSMGLLRVRHD